MKTKKVRCFAPYYFDVDQTLVFSGPDCMSMTGDPLNVMGERFDEWVVPNKEIIRDLKWLANRGHTIIVWSKEGQDWAEAVVKALKLDSYVALCLEKPTGFYDDLEPSEFMGKRHYRVPEEQSDD